MRREESAKSAARSNQEQNFSRARASVPEKRVRAGEGCACLLEISECGDVCDVGAYSRACTAEGRGQLGVDGGCARACECVEAGR